MLCHSIAGGTGSGMGQSTETLNPKAPIPISSHSSSLTLVYISFHSCTRFAEHAFAHWRSRFILEEASAVEILGSTSGMNR